MIDTIVGNRLDWFDGTIALEIALIAITACSRSATAPTPTPTAFTVVGGTAQSGTVGAALATPIMVKVTDQSGKAMGGVTVAFTPAAASGAVSSSQVKTDSTGAAQVSWTLGTVAGGDSLTVTVATLTPATVIATAVPDAPAAITIVAGNDQNAPAGSGLAAPLTVKVTDRYGNAVPGATVQWGNDGGGALATTTTVTDANGVAQDTYTLGPTAGPEDVMATIFVGGLPMTASFTEQGV